MDLKYTQISYRQVKYHDLEEFVQKTYPFLNRGSKDKYSFIATQECGNDSSHDFFVTSKLDEYELQEWEEIKSGDDYTYRNGLILNKLCSDGHIEPGYYLIQVCW